VATVITVSVTPANSAPVPTAPALTTAQNTAGTRQVSPNDPDPGQSFTFSISTAPAHGSATVNASGLATYTPTTGFAGTDSFIVTVTDNGTPPLAGTVTIAVTVTASQNRPPTGASCGTARTIVEGNTTSLNVTAFDPDGDVLSFAWQQNTPATPTGVFSAPTAASTTWTATGVAADTSFTLQVSVTDPQGAAATCQVSVTVKKTSAFVLDDINSTLDDDTRRLQ
jgi:VCBS repeat-containing protein